MAHYKSSRAQGLLAHLLYFSTEKQKSCLPCKLFLDVLNFWLCIIFFICNFLLIFSRIYYDNFQAQGCVCPLFSAQIFYIFSIPLHILNSVKTLNSKLCSCCPVLWLPSLSTSATIVARLPPLQATTSCSIPLCHKAPKLLESKKPLNSENTPVLLHSNLLCWHQPQANLLPKDIS